MSITILGPRDKTPEGIAVINTTTASKTWSKGLSPMLVSAKPVAKNIENLWQFSKVYKQHVDDNNKPTKEWEHWRKLGFEDSWAHRYPMGKNAKPLYSMWKGQELGYIDAREQIYIPEYAKAVVNTEAFRKLKELYTQERKIALWDFDGYNHDALNMTLEQVVKCSGRKMGHAFVLKMLLLKETQ